MSAADISDTDHRIIGVGDGELVESNQVLAGCENTDRKLNQFNIIFPDDVISLMVPKCLLFLQTK